MGGGGYFFRSSTFDSSKLSLAHMHLLEPFYFSLFCCPRADPRSGGKKKKRVEGRMDEGKRGEGDGYDVCTCKQEDDLFLGTVLDRHLGDACLDLVDGSLSSRGGSGIIVILDPRSPCGSGERGEVVTGSNILVNAVAVCRSGVAVVNVDMVRVVVVGLGVGDGEILLQIAFAVKERLLVSQVVALLWLLV